MTYSVVIIIVKRSVGWQMCIFCCSSIWKKKIIFIYVYILYVCINELKTWLLDDIKASGKHELTNKVRRNTLKWFFSFKKNKKKKPTNLKHLLDKIEQLISLYTRNSSWQVSNFFKKVLILPKHLCLGWLMSLLNLLT